MTTFNSNVVGELDHRTLVGPTKIRSPTRYSDMFVGAEEDVIDSMMEGARAARRTKSGATSRQKTSPAPMDRLQSLRHRAKENRDIQSLPDTHYIVVESIPEAMSAAAMLAEYHSISVLWEGFNVNRYGTLTWIICGYLGSAVLFNLQKIGEKAFTDGGLRTLLEASHPIKVIHDCRCLADILFHQYRVQLNADSIFDTHAADLLIQSKSKQTLVTKTLTECLIEYQDIPISVYRTRESIMRRDSSVWVFVTIPPELLLATARMARYAALLYGQMLSDLSKPLPQITEMFLNSRYQGNSPDPKVRSIPAEVESLLVNVAAKPAVRTEWNIPETVINPVYESQPGEEHFYSKPFKFDPKKATPGSLKIFSVDPNKPCAKHDDDWEMYVQTAPVFEESFVEEESDDEASVPVQDTSTQDETHLLFKVPDMFSEVSSSTTDSILRGLTSRDLHKVTSPEETDSESSSGDGVNVIIPQCTLPPTVLAMRDPSLLGSKIVWPGEPGSDKQPGPMMSAALSEMVEQIRAEQKENVNSYRSNAYISAEEMRRTLEDERRRVLPTYNYPDTASEHSSRSQRSKESSEKEIIKIIAPRTYEIVSNNSTSGDDVIIERPEGAPPPLVYCPLRSETSPTSRGSVTSPRSCVSMTSPASRGSMTSPRSRVSMTSPASLANRPPPLIQTPPRSITGPPPLVQTPPRSTFGPPPLVQTPPRSTTGPPPLVQTPPRSTPGLPPLVQTPPRSTPPLVTLLGDTTLSAHAACFRPSAPQHISPPPRVASNVPCIGSTKRAPLVIVPKFRAVSGRGRGMQHGFIPPPLIPAAPTETLTPRTYSSSRGRGRAAGISDRTITHDFLTTEERSASARTSRATSPSRSRPSRGTSPSSCISRGNYCRTSRAASVANSDGGYDQDFYGTGVALSTDCQEQKCAAPQDTGSHRREKFCKSPRPASRPDSLPQSECGFDQDFYGPNVQLGLECGSVKSGTATPLSARNTPGTLSPMKTPVSLCYAYDSDDPDYL